MPFGVSRWGCASTLLQSCLREFSFWRMLSVHERQQLSKPAALISLPFYVLHAKARVIGALLEKRKPRGWRGVKKLKHSVSVRHARDKEIAPLAEAFRTKLFG
jgi:hypothetical protein